MRSIVIPESLECFGAIDSHAHIDSGNYGSESEVVLERSFAHGLSAIVLIASGESVDEFQEVRRRAESDERLRFAAGIHPHTASRFGELWGAVEGVLESPSCVALGEVGLDFHYNFSGREDQILAFRAQIESSLSRDLPLVLHIRNAYGESLELLKSYRDQFRGIVHCFSGDRKEALDFVELGFHVSFSGMLTFRQSLEMREAAKVVPNDRILVETDSPYLAPEPHRGGRNEPSLLAYTLAELGRLKGLLPSEVAQLTMRNTRTVFRMPTVVAG